jgi:hypothetical protein
MLRVTVALIVVTLTGVPVVPAICLSWCGEHKTTTEYCHDEAVGNGSAALLTDRAECRALVTDDPFIREDARPVLHAVPSLPVPSTVPASTSTTHTAIALRRNVVHGVSAATLVLRL